MDDNFDPANNINFVDRRSFDTRRRRRRRRGRASCPADKPREQHEQLEPGESGEPTTGEPASSPATATYHDNTSIGSNGNLYGRGESRGREQPP